MMKKMCINTVVGIAVVGSLGVSAEAFAHAGVLTSHNAWDNTSATSPPGNSNGGYLEGTSPILGVTISHSCADAEPYPTVNHVVVVLPIGKDTLLLDGSKVNAPETLPGSLTKAEDLQINGLFAQEATANAWNFTLTGLPSGVSTGTSGVTGPKTLANAEFKYQPDFRTGTLFKTAVVPFVDSHNKIHSEETHMLVWAGGEVPNERYVVLEFKPTLPRFPNDKAGAGTAGRCATQAKLYIPTLQICEAATGLGQKKFMAWQIAPTPRFDTSNMGETARLHAPSFIVNRDLVKNPLPSDCPATEPAEYDPATAATVYVYPATAVIDQAFSYAAEALKISPSSASDKVHGCVALQKWDESAKHCTE